MTFVKRNQRKPNVIRFQLLWKIVSLHRNEVRLIATLAAITGYMVFASPAVLMTAIIIGTIAIAFGLINRSAQSVAGLGLPIQGWHLASIVIAISALVGMGSTDPVLAQMFNNLEQSVNDAINNTGGTSISPETITTIFNIFRILIVLAFLIGVVIVFTQATRGGDWQPIANLLAIGIAFVIGVEVISTLIIGGGASAGG
ncbi:MAG: hypothetical protein ACTS2F_10840 [Thainema sp.]